MRWISVVVLGVLGGCGGGGGGGDGDGGDDGPPSEFHYHQVVGLDGTLYVSDGPDEYALSGGVLFKLGTQSGPIQDPMLIGYQPELGLPVLERIDLREDSVATSIVADGADGVFVAGNTLPPLQSDPRPFVVRMSSTGEVTWARLLEAASGYAAFPRRASLAAVVDGRVVLASGYSLIVLDTAGEVLWARDVEPGPLSCRNAQAVIADDDAIFVVGDDCGGLTIDRFDWSGDVVWSRRASGATDLRILGALLRSDGQLIVSYWQYEQNGGDEDAGVLLVGGDGTLLDHWGYQIFGTANVEGTDFDIGGLASPVIIRGSSGEMVTVVRGLTSTPWRQASMVWPIADDGAVGELWSAATGPFTAMPDGSVASLGGDQVAIGGLGAPCSDFGIVEVTLQRSTTTLAPFASLDVYVPDSVVAKDDIVPEDFPVTLTEHQPVTLAPYPGTTCPE
jgi:hypothetical protein